jgi:mannose/cellobiose epimerase-like protein (N-acyl-D-glucosamine 2-epimerase family)
VSDNTLVVHSNRVAQLANSPVAYRTFRLATLEFTNREFFRDFLDEPQQQFIEHSDCPLSYVDPNHRFSEYVITPGLYIEHAYYVFSTQAAVTWAIYLREFVMCVEIRRGSSHGNTVSAASL